MHSLRYFFAVSILSICPLIVSGQEAKPAPCPPDLARGVVRLKVNLLASGKVGDVSILSGLSNSLNNQAIEHVKGIIFEPKKVDGKPVDAVVTTEYTFTIFYDDNSPDLLKAAEIISIPPLKVSRKLKDQTKLKVGVELSEDGKARIAKIETFPAKIRDVVTEAVESIKFKPAIHRCGSPVPQQKEIEFIID